MDEDHIRRRAACDRCHAQKIRCPRQPGQDVCNRCVKARTPCIFSPFRQKKIPETEREAYRGTVASPDYSSNEQSVVARSSASSTNRKRQRIRSTHIEEDPIDFNQEFILGGSSVQADTLLADGMVDWMSDSFPLCQDFPESTFGDLNSGGQNSFLSIDLNNSATRSHHESPPKVDSGAKFLRASNLSRTFKSLANVAECLPPQPSFREPSGSSTTWGQTAEILEPESESSCIRKLSQLSIDLFEHSNTVPPLSIYDSSTLSLEDNLASMCPQDFSKYHVDETLRLTQSLINLYPTFLNAFLPHLTSESSKSSSNRSSERLYNTYFETAQHPTAASESSSRASTLQALDHSSILLILACHLRLIGIYEALFKHMHACLKQREISWTQQQSTLNVAPLKIGSFEPPPSAAIPMQMLLLVQFASQLFNYAADLASELGVPEGGTPNSESSNRNSSDNSLALTRAAAENVRSRASNMSQELGFMRALMLQSGHLA